MKATTILLLCLVLSAVAYDYLGFHPWHRVAGQIIEGRDLSVRGVIASIPQRDQQHCAFVFDTSEYGLIKLNWYQPEINVHPGEHWQFLVRLKKPHAYKNPGTFDYARWLKLHDIVATGYIKPSVQNSLLQPCDKYYFLLRWRDDLDQKLMTLPAQSAATISGLVLGISQHLNSLHKQILRDTGTAHLLAISGLHVGLVAGFFFLILHVVWRLFPYFCLHIPAYKVAAVSAMIGATCYSAVSGFGVATERALIMIVVMLSQFIHSRQFSIVDAIVISLCVVLLHESRQLFLTGFWLSYVAVILLVYGMSCRVSETGIWWRFGRTQWVCGVGLLPLSLWYYQQASLCAFWANLVAIPFVGMVIVPIALLGVLLVQIVPAVGLFILHYLSYAIDLLWWYLETVASVPLLYHQAISSVTVLGFSAIGVLLLLLPKGMQGRWFGLVLLLPLVYPQLNRPQHGQIWLTTLDVGQGLAVVVQTSDHTLLYDSGAHSAFFDCGKSIVLPWLGYQQIKKLDMMVISHGDNDHSGGSHVIRQSLPVDLVLSSEPRRFEAQRCIAGQKWQWDGVTFEVLFPTQTMNSGNNHSCVIRVKGQHGSVLLTGDIEKKAEKKLLSLGVGIDSDVLVVPHHGSRTSSSESFLRAVQPKVAVFSYGYRNRYRHPSKVVVKRYEDMGVIVRSTEQEGAVKVEL